MDDLQVIEQENTEQTVYLDGEVILDQQRTRNFLNLKAAQDYCLTFGIENYNLRSGLIDNKKVVQVVYANQQ